MYSTKKKHLQTPQILSPKKEKKNTSDRHLDSYSKKFEDIKWAFVKIMSFKSKA